MPAEQYAEIMDHAVAQYWQNIACEWDKMAQAWQTERGMWLLGPANYVLKTECLWAVDPMLRVREAETMLLSCVGRGLAGMRFALISHLHSDHYRLPFLREACAPGVSLAVPDWIGEGDLAVLRETGAEVIPVCAGMHLQFDGIAVDVLPGWHYDFNRPEKGVPSLAFMVKTREKTFLFPGDVRDFDRCQMPIGCDVMAGHVWLGRNSALLAPEETALQQYVRFVQRLQPKRLLLTHLYDLRRQASDMWTYQHAKWIQDALRGSGIQADIPMPGETITL